MTQEELDAMMADPDGLELMDIVKEETKETEEAYDNSFIHTLSDSERKKVDTYKVKPTQSWPPPPPTNDHKIVDQLDQVTRESEEKATKIFDNLEHISDDMIDSCDLLKNMQDKVDYFGDIFNVINKKFPHIKTFKEAHEEIYSLKRGIEQLQASIDKVDNETLEAMDTMQFQDIHRQKIERVVNVMRALSRYMNDLLEGEKDDSKRVSSASHIVGDTTTNDVVGNDDIEALIAQFGS